MCHPEVPEGQEPVAVEREEVGIPLTRNEVMPALFCAPQLPQRGATLIVGDVFGRTAFYEDLCGRLALAGFQALLPDLFFRQGPVADATREAAMERVKRLDQRQTLRDLDIVLNWLQQRPYAAGLVGTIGFCMGGTLALDIAAEREDVATVCFYGFPAGSRQPNAPPVPLEEVERMTGPILGFWGDGDTGVGIENVHALDRALAQHGIEHSFTIFPGVGHGFMAASRLEPSTPAYAAACQAWTATVDFLRRHIE
jgi:carboxymethylenebutenolidase